MIDRGFLMPRMSAIYLCVAALAASALAGCAQAPPYGQPTVYWGSFPQQPPDYSPDYASVPVVDHRGRTRYVLVPKACLTPDGTEPEFLGPHLPPGCANAHNLQRMAERQGDLVRGRPLGAAPAAPSARAAQEYIYGSKGTLGGGLARSPNSQVQGAGTESVTEKPAGTK
jgi:type IV pilus biogenesis protein CpaD/CtpE